MTNRFTDKVALVTGGATGMGLATARLLHAEGATVVITGRRAELLESAAADLGTRALAIPADVAKPTDLDEVYRRITEELGRLDVVFANAGVGVFKPATEWTEPDVDHLLGVNLKGVFFTVTKALPLLSRGGSVVLNASWTQYRGMSGASLYSASKAAVTNLTRTLSTELAPRGIRINSVSPGYISTDMMTGTTDAAGRESFRREVPIGELGTSEQVAAAVAFLASDAAAYVTGTDLIVDGGLTYAPVR
ncbi:NAD(P)-dependent dehydrogenase (short-subunit alcohol dehydrogenase family) [Crossiella equi]|uniref:NAD(P)-dependent dehydrogenase (Short-subunit alcohol dehydrogenase family) n=1 Tax=Crossiella equi TaxID=130796 RepID=A0ABS5A7F7_9PSEU|nr:glucose 1-dehydrogenase [Crossiella equi]MBP2472534.1 NAD(P)-dependent dehydrogenase (short-subunit alcohol dehydrogenase family) [Crossiella equi]